MNPFFDLFAVAVLIALLGGVVGALVAMFLVPWRILLAVTSDDEHERR